MRKFPSFFIPLGIVIFLASFFFTKQFIQNPPCANSISCISDLSGKFDNKQATGEFMGKKVMVPKEELVQPQLALSVLGDNTLEKRIEIDLTNQRLYGVEGNAVVYDFPVSTGKWGRTPTGTFNIWVKLRYTTMSGGNKAIGTYYYLPGVPYTMFFYNDEVPKTRGYGIHGTYWHNNFGHPMSHGCINMRTEDVEKLYSWAGPPSIGHTTYATKDNEGTKIVIYGEAPLE